MPKGVKVVDRQPPAEAGCDFCGRKFKPDRWNSRTCLSCFTQRCPDQSRTEWGAYQTALLEHQRARGVKPKRRAPNHPWRGFRFGKGLGKPSYKANAGQKSKGATP